MGMTFYKNSIQNFCNQNEYEIFGIIARNDLFDTTFHQKAAWIEQIRTLKEQLSDVEEGNIIFEYTIPRVGGRIDNILLIGSKIFVIEFKTGAESYDLHSIVQARTYALDLSNFHEESRNKEIIPILIASNAPNKEPKYKAFNKKIQDVVLSNGTNLKSILAHFANNKDFSIDLEKWINSRYVPIPTIIEATEILYRNHTVEDIYKNEAAKNLTKTSTAVQEIITYSKENNKKSICFITGVPGAGKTLAGLNIAIENQKTTGKNYSCFLTGNQPLVTVLKEALAKDEQKRTGTTIGKAREKVKSFIQIIHHFRDTALMQIDTPPIDNVVVFDEAQRAWNQEKLSKFMKEKKSNILNNLSKQKCDEVLNMSESELLIEYMNRRKDWAVIVCLVGGGQDINDGEAGIEEWFNSLRRSFSGWNVFISDQITGKEYTRNNSLKSMLSGLNCKIVQDLHLSVALRSFRSEQVSDFVHHLLDNDKEKAAEIYKNIKEVYPIYMTRNLNTAKSWIKNKTRDRKCRYGIIASSKAKRLRSEGIWVECKCKPEKWFLENESDIKSSYHMEEAATEFDIQGLEIDWAIVGWDADYRYENGDFEYYIPKGSKWNKINKEADKRYLKNAYRVLLTRAREGFIIFVPKGDNNDSTRLCKFYDELWAYLEEIGIDVIQL